LLLTLSFPIKMGSMNNYGNRRKRGRRVLSPRVTFRKNISFCIFGSERSTSLCGVKRPQNMWSLKNNVQSIFPSRQILKYRTYHAVEDR
jgi:hypothetical protein